MKILHIITNLELGGAETVLFRLVSKNPHDDAIAVIALGQGGVYSKRIQELGITVHSLGMPRGTATIKGILRLYRLIRAYQPDVIQTWMYHADLIGGIVGRLAGIKTIIWGIRHSNLHPDDTSAKTRLVAKLCAALSRWVPSSIISCSRTAVGTHIRLGYSAKKFKVVPNGYELNQVAPDSSAGSAIRSELNILDGIPVIGMVARLNPQKDHLNLINALALLKQKGIAFICLLIGQGLDNENKELRTSMKDLNIADSVLLLGQRNDVISVMNTLDLHVLSSSSGEGFPNVVAEAMACGTPCVTTDVGDAAIIVGEEGWIVPPQNSKALATAIAAAIHEKETDIEAWKQRKTLCRNKIVNNYSIDTMRDAYRKVWSDDIAMLKTAKNSAS